MAQRLDGFAPFWVGATFDNGAFSVRCETMCGVGVTVMGDLCFAVAILVRWPMVLQQCGAVLA